MVLVSQAWPPPRRRSLVVEMATELDTGPSRATGAIVVKEEPRHFGSDVGDVDVHRVIYGLHYFIRVKHWSGWSF